MNITDELLYHHGAAARDLWLASATPARGDVPVYQPSPRFLKKMKGLLRRQEQPPWIRTALAQARRAAVILLAVLSVTFAGLMTSQAFREAFVQIIVEILDDIGMTHFTYSGEGVADARADKTVFSYVPQGFAEVERREDRHNCYVHFEHKNGAVFQLRRAVVDETVTGVYGIDTEDAEVRHINIHGARAMEVTKNRECTLVWTEGYFFNILSGVDISSEELEQIAQGIE